MSAPTLYLMVGYPGAGKTTVAGLISQLTGAVHLSSDQARIELFPKPKFSQTEHDKLYDYLDKKTEELLSQGKSVIYDANLNRYQHRHDKYEICKRTDATPVLVWVQTNKTLAKERAVHESRAHLVPGHETAHDMFDRIADIIEPPHSDEQPIIIDGTEVSSELIAGALKLA